MKHAITIEIDTEVGALDNYTDEYIAMLWNVAQANPAPISDIAAGETAEAVGREIIRRFVLRTGPPLWHHQGNHAYWHILQKRGTFRNGEWSPHAVALAAKGE